MEHGIQLANVHVSAHVVWNTQQIKEVLDLLDFDNGIIKVEIQHGFESGKQPYHIMVWRYPTIEVEKS